LLRLRKSANAFCISPQRKQSSPASSSSFSKQLLVLRNTRAIDIRLEWLLSQLTYITNPLSVLWCNLVVSVGLGFEFRPVMKKPNVIPATTMESKRIARHVQQAIQNGLITPGELDKFPPDEWEAYLEGIEAIRERLGIPDLVDQDHHNGK